MHYVYFLWSEKLQKVYIGETVDVALQFQNHNAGLQRYTKKGIPWTCIAYIEFTTVKEAKKEELILKKARNRDYLRWYIQKHGKLFRDVTG